MNLDDLEQAILIAAALAEDTGRDVNDLVLSAARAQEVSPDSSAYVATIRRMIDARLLLGDYIKSGAGQVVSIAVDGLTMSGRFQLRNLPSPAG